ncbi:MAG: PIG-L deacetylase family protein [Acidimicrobiia bacterium]
MTGGPLLVVVAHPDDETFGCGSLLALAAARGLTTIVACATRGEAGTPKPGLGIDDADLATVREAELRAAAAFLGVSRVELFAWTDSGMEGSPAPGSLVDAPLDDVAREVAALIDDVHPGVIVTLDGSDGHRDHAHIRDATRLASARADWRTPRVYQQCLPQALMRKWVEVLKAKQPESEHLGLGELGTPEALITSVVDTSAVLQVREQAMALHASQTSPYEAMPDDLRREFLTVERLRRVVPEWAGGPLETDIFPATEDGS